MFFLLQHLSSRFLIFLNCIHRFSFKLSLSLYVLTGTNSGWAGCAKYGCQDGAESYPGSLPNADYYTR